MGEASKIIRFGTFEVDLAAAELRKQGLKLRLQEQPFQVLAALLENPGEVVIREDLIARLWPDGTVVDFDRGLNAAVTRLRQVLSDSAETPRYVETVARRGYRFIASVEMVTAGSVLEVPPVEALPRKYTYLWPSIAAAVLVVGIAAWWFIRQQSPAPEGPYTVVPLTSEPGFEQHPSFSPDGSQVAFEWKQDTGESHIYIKVTGTGDPVRLTSAPEAEFGPGWSRDGRQIAFLRILNEDTMGLFVIPAVGGAERKIAEFYRPYWANLNELRRLDWMPDSRNVVLSAAEHPSIDEKLYRVDTTSGKTQAITTPPAHPTDPRYGDREPAVSPDGRTVAFIRGTLAGVDLLHVQSLSAEMQTVGEARQLLPGHRSSSPSWSPNGQEIIFKSGASLARIGLTSNATPREFLTLGSNIFTPTVSASGKLAYSHRLHDANIWRQEVPVRGGVTPAPQSLIASTADDLNAQYSPDGSRIAFQSRRSGPDEIWVCNSDGSHCLQITNTNKGKTGSPRWSPDGKWIAFDSSFEGTAFNVYVVSANGGPLRRLTEKSGAIPSWSNDGKWIYFNFAKASISEIWKAPSAGGAAVQVTKNGGWVALESPGGKWLYYIKSGSYLGRRIWRSALDGSGEIEILNGASRRAFAIGADSIYYIREKSDAEITIRRFHLATHEDTRISTMSKPTYLGLSLSPDGKYLTYTQVDHDGADLMMVENFR